MARVALIEDDDRIREALVRGLIATGHQVLARSTGLAGLQLIVDEAPDARFKEAGLTLQLLPVGPPEQESATAPAKPPSETTLAA